MGHTSIPSTYILNIKIRTIIFTSQGCWGERSSGTLQKNISGFSLLPSPSLPLPPSLPRGRGMQQDSQRKIFSLLSLKRSFDTQTTDFKEPRRRQAGYSALGRDEASLNQGEQGKEGES